VEHRRGRRQTWWWARFEKPASSRRAEELAALASEGDFDGDGRVEQFRAPMKVGRNERCPCGSGKKYKKCFYKLQAHVFLDLGLVTPFVT
jgi:uncharacterized protein YchJ